MIDETRALIRGFGLPFMWVIDDDTRPHDLSSRLAARGVPQDEELHAMILPVSTHLDPGEAGVEIVDALRDEATYIAAEEVQCAAFGTPLVPGQHERFEEGRADAARHFFLALLDGRPAGAGWATVSGPGVMMNGGAVDPRFQGRGVYRALVAARLDLARSVGAAGLATHARPDTSGPILAAFGFCSVGTIRLHPDI
jgi:GNAT superfamily N-acetyltransferase